LPRIETIGDCTLYLGDCREILPTLPNVDAVVTDPPYGMQFRSNHRTIKHDAIANDDDYDSLWFATRILASHSIYVFCRWDNLWAVPTLKSLITWVKNNWSMGDLAHEHARQTESILFYPGPRHFFPNGRPQDVITGIRTDNGLHPTEKPADVMGQIIRWTEGIVCDPFMGSGTTGVACVKLGRKFIGVEIEPKYFDIACRRIEEATRQGDMFRDIEKRATEIQEKLEFTEPLCSREAAE